MHLLKDMQICRLMIVSCLLWCHRVSLEALRTCISFALQSLDKHAMASPASLYESSQIIVSRDAWTLSSSIAGEECPLDST
jgi:hypothetical protein